MVDPNYDDGRGLYLDSLTVRTPVGFREEIREAAAAERVPVSQYIRQALSERIAQTRAADGKKRSAVALAC
jgi:hypothetical protein